MQIQHYLQVIVNKMQEFFRLNGEKRKNEFAKISSQSSINFLLTINKIEQLMQKLLIIQNIIENLPISNFKELTN
jgi:hypothetical protein